MTFFRQISRRTALQVALASVTAGSTIGRRSVRGADSLVFTAKHAPLDRRRGDLKQLNDYFPWEPSPSVAQWNTRAEDLRQQVLVAAGLWPMPTKRPLNAVVHGQIKRDDYAVERVILHTGDGLFCTGSLYRPLNAATKTRPGILCPHGHWPGGRFHDHGEEKLKSEIESGAEQFASGRHPLQARCVQLARMGCVVFLYDMLGYADSGPLTKQLIHDFKTKRPELENIDRWGLFSAQSELRCLNVLGLQTWNSIRALDWISELDDVDPKRIGVTGESGGGTQTFLLGAIDPRPTALFAAVMVSTAMQGGCTCENAAYLRVGTGNVELAALIAPRPLGLSAADDWTRELETKGLPQLQKHFEMLDVPGNLQGKYFPFEHNYNRVSRSMMYEFFNEHLKLGQSSPIIERDFVPLTRDEATVWYDEHPAPHYSEEAELRILRDFATDQGRQFADLKPNDVRTLDTYRRVIGGAWNVMIGRRLPGKGEFTYRHTDTVSTNSLTKFYTIVRLTREEEEIATLIYVPKHWNKQTAIWVTDTGKSGLLKENDAPIELIRKLLDAGFSVVLPDLIYQGESRIAESRINGASLTKSREVALSRDSLGFTAGYNHLPFAQRVHDILTLIAFSRYGENRSMRIHLLGLGRIAGPLVAAAAFQAKEAIDTVAITTDGFRFGGITTIRDPMMVPGAVKYGDVPGLLPLLAPTRLLIADTSPKDDAMQLALAGYAAVGASRKLTLLNANPQQQMSTAVGWLLTQQHRPDVRH